MGVLGRQQGETMRKPDATRFAMHVCFSMVAIVLITINLVAAEMSATRGPMLADVEIANAYRSAADARRSPMRRDDAARPIATAEW
jgi:hypothetical protein